MNMKSEHCKTLGIVIFVSAMVFLSFGKADAQIQSAGGGYYIAGYGNVYGSFGQASAAQSRMYDQMRLQNRKRTERDALIKQWGLAAVEKAEREAAAGSAKASNPKIVVPPPPVVRNHGVFRPDNTVDTAKTLADALAATPAERALIEQIYTATKAAYEKEADARGWKNNIAAGLTFFTVTAMTVYRDAPEPSDEAVINYFKSVNVYLDETPEFASVPNKDKQGFNNMLIGFSGLLLAGYTEGKQQNDSATVASYGKLAGELIKIVLKADPENLRYEKGKIVMR
ncbi:hypothetical protein BH10ACI3_BH10ACI3_30110 [soil metagenome]